MHVYAIYYVVAIWPAPGAAPFNKFIVDALQFILSSGRLAWHATSICLNIWHNSLFNFGRHVNRALTFATRSDRNFHSDAVAVALILLITFSVYTNLAFHWKRAAIFAGTVWKYITASDNCGNNAN